MSKNTGTSELINYFDLGANGDVGIAGSLDVNTIANATTDTDRFLVSDTGVIKYRTGAELLSDIGAQGLLTNPITGSGTSGTIPVFTGSTTIGNSIVQSNSTQVNIVGNGSQLLFDSLGESKTGGIQYTNDFELLVYNSRGTGSAIYLGNTNLDFHTNVSGNPRVRIESNGNVGIGTSTPTSSFNARLAVRNEDAANNPTLVLFKNINSGSAEDIFRVQSWNGAFNTVASIKANGSANFLSSVSATSLRSSTVGTFGFNTASNGEFQIYSTAESGLVMAGRGSSFDMVITNKNGADTIRIPTGTTNVNFVGNVLINTTTDAGHKLDVNGTTILRNNVYTTGESGIELSWSGSTINDTRNGRIRAISTPSQNPYAGGLAFDYFKFNVSSYAFFEGMRINGSGNVGIGTTTPTSGKLVVSDASSTKIVIAGGATQNGMTWEAAGGANSFYLFNGTISSAGWGIYNVNTGAFPFFATNGGNVLIGTTTDTGYKLYVLGAAGMGVSSSVTANNYIANTQGLNVAGYGFLTQTISGQMTILGHNLAASTSVANQVNVVNGGWYSSMIKMYYSAGITFHTSSTVYSAGDVYPMDATERIKIKTNGEVIFHNSIILRNGQINSLTSSDSGQSMYLNFQGNGAIYAGSSYTVLYAGSDERIKTEINHSQSTLTKILNLTPRTFKYKERPEITNYGFIAQEVEKIMPELVRTSEGITMCLDEQIENQKSVESYGLAWASILVKAIQEQQQQIQELKNKLS